eukprot:scaffold2438_cov69-Phaeocystis_antarctica.AAC.5
MKCYWYFWAVFPPRAAATPPRRVGRADWRQPLGRASRAWAEACGAQAVLSCAEHLERFVPFRGATLRRRQPEHALTVSERERLDHTSAALGRPPAPLPWGHWDVLVDAPDV